MRILLCSQSRAWESLTAPPRTTTLPDLLLLPKLLQVGSVFANAGQQRLHLRNTVQASGLRANYQISEPTAPPCRASSACSQAGHILTLFKQESKWTAGMPKYLD